MENYTIASNLDITNLSLSDGAYRCYNLLLSLAYGDKTQVYPSIKYLACALGRSCRTINRYIKELVSLNLISIRRRGSISNLYTLLKKKTQQVIEKVQQAVKGVKKDTINDKKDTKESTKKNYNYYKKKESTFNNYPQREYDSNKLEEMLLGGNGNYEDCLIE